MNGYVERELGQFRLLDHPYSVATSAAPDTIRVYDLGVGPLSIEDSPMVCTIAGVWRGVPVPSWASEYIGQSDGAMAAIVRSAVDLAQHRVPGVWR
ncbi:hypothetical protein [Stackebrandtia soli]|uniref:hypothetical protein n=1 Tax=Stackebrandtia soli TaxID=1892856 RepID=UPI0039E9278F